MLSLQATLPLGREQVVTAFPNLSRPQATVLGLYSFGIIAARRCGLNSVAITLAALMSAKYLTIRSRLQEFYQPASAKSKRRDRGQLDVTTCFAPLLAWVLKGWPSTRLALALDATSLGDRFHRAGDQRRLPRQRHPRGLEGPARQRRPRLEARVDRLAPRVLRPGPARLGRAGDDRSRPLRPLAVPGDLGLGLASPDADHSPEQVPRGRLDAERGGRGCWSSPRADVGEGGGWRSPRGPRRRLECTLLACWEPGHEGSPVRADRPAPRAGPSRCGTGCGADRARIPAAQERRLAMASDADDRPRPRGAIVARAGGGHGVRAGRRRRGGDGVRGRMLAVETTPPASSRPPADRRPCACSGRKPERRPTGTKRAPGQHRPAKGSSWRRGLRSRPRPRDGETPLHHNLPETSSGTRSRDYNATSVNHLDT